jgi:hypothetical protein
LDPPSDQELTLIETSVSETSSADESSPVDVPSSETSVPQTTLATQEVTSTNKNDGKPNANPALDLFKNPIVIAGGATGISFVALCALAVYFKNRLHRNQAAKQNTISSTPQLSTSLQTSAAGGTMVNNETG